MTLKGMRKADQQMILDTLGMDDAQATNTTTRSEPAGVPLVAVPESGPLGAAFESNTRYVSLNQKRKTWPCRIEGHMLAADPSKHGGLGGHATKA